MKKEELKEILDLHTIWLQNFLKGKKANLQGADLHGANLRMANLRRADLKNANLQNADLRNVNLNFVNLQNANLRNADLRNANLQHAYLCYADLQDANLYDANLYGANLKHANLCNACLYNTNLCYINLNGADLNNTYLRGADLCNANLCNANLHGVFLEGAKLHGANLSQVKNSPFFSQYKWLYNNFKKDKEGFFVYKRIGDTDYEIPDDWKIKEKLFITEEVDTDRLKDCSYGVNFGNKKFILKNYIRSNIWLCKLYFEDLTELCVPIYTDGKARCSRLQLLRILSEEELRKY